VVCRYFGRDQDGDIGQPRHGGVGGEKNDRQAVRPDQAQGCRPGLMRRHTRRRLAAGDLRGGTFSLKFSLNP
jgi:hypothetical protein